MISGVPSLSFPGVNQIANDQLLPRSWGTAARLSEGKLFLVGESTGHRDIMEGGTYFPLPCRGWFEPGSCNTAPSLQNPGSDSRGPVVGVSL